MSRSQWQDIIVFDINYAGDGYGGVGDDDSDDGCDGDDGVGNDGAYGPQVIT